LSSSPKQWCHPEDIRQGCLKDLNVNRFSNFVSLLQFERRFEENLEARGGIEPPIKVLQTFALPLGDRALVLQERPENTKPTGRLLWRWVETQSKLDD
jgi:hypothetical protein